MDKTTSGVVAGLAGAGDPDAPIFDVLSGQLGAAGPMSAVAVRPSGTWCFSLCFDGVGDDAST